MKKQFLFDFNITAINYILDKKDQFLREIDYKGAQYFYKENDVNYGLRFGFTSETCVDMKNMIVVPDLWELIFKLQKNAMNMDPQTAQANLDKFCPGDRKATIDLLETLATSIICLTENRLIDNDEHNGTNYCAVYKNNVHTLDNFIDVLSVQNDIGVDITDLSLTDVKNIRSKYAIKKDIGRNDPCHCGSSKKYKFCHGSAVG